MDRMKRILCYVMVIVVTIGFSFCFSVSSSAAELTKTTFELLPSDFEVQLGNQYTGQILVFGPSDSPFGVNDRISAIVPNADSAWYFSVRVRLYEERLVLDNAYGISAVSMKIVLKWRVHYDSNIYGNRSPVFKDSSFQLFCPSTKEQLNCSSFYKVDELSYGSYDCTLTINATVDSPEDFDVGNFSVFVLGSNYLYPVDDGSGTFANIVIEPFVSTVECTYYRNTASDKINDALTSGSGKYDGASSDVESGSSDIVNDASNMFSEMEDFEHSWQDSVQGIYDSLPDSKNPYDSLQGGLVIQRSDGTFISKTWELFEEHREISIFFTAGLLIVCVYFFLRR